MPCSILVANNGLAAVKFISYVRRWASEAFGHDRTVTFVAMATPEDMRVNAEHIRLADQFMEVRAAYCPIEPHTRRTPQLSWSQGVRGAAALLWMACLSPTFASRHTGNCNLQR